jgi:hypothetical protein
MSKLNIRNCDSLSDQLSGQKRKRSEGGSGLEILGKGKRAAAMMGIFALVAVVCFVGFQQSIPEKGINLN